MGSGNQLCKTYSCVNQSILVALICLIIFICLLVGIFSYYLCKYFGIPYFLKGGYHYDRSDIKSIVLIEPVPFEPKVFQKENALAILSTIRVAINIPIRDMDIPNLPYDLEIEPVKGTDGNVYAVFFHFPKHAITMLCWINLRYVKQWRCFFETHLVYPSCITKNEKKFQGKCWACIHYFYKMVQTNIWKVWNENFKYRTSQLVIVGHSLGGAMAPVCALDFVLHGNLPSDKLFVYISGSPRCGDKKFIEEFNSLIPNAWNIANTFDLITLTPPVYSENSYDHIGNMVYFSLPHTKGLGASHLLRTYLKYFQQNGPITKMVSLSGSK